MPACIQTEHQPPRRGRARRAIVTLVAAIAGLTVAAIAGLAGLAGAKSFVLGTVSHAKVTNMITHTVKHANIVTDSHGVALYTLTNDTMQHPGCTRANGCFAFWFPATVPSKNTKLTKAPGVKGTVGLFHRDGFYELTLNRHPLYTFKLDMKQRGVAVGEGIPSFGGVWHVIPDAPSSTHITTNPNPPTTTTSTTPTTTNPYGY